MHQLQRSWVRSQHPSAQWNLRGGRRSSAENRTKEKEKNPPKNILKKIITLQNIPCCLKEIFADIYGFVLLNIWPYVTRKNQYSFKIQHLTVNDVWPPMHQLLLCKCAMVSQIWAKLVGWVGAAKFMQKFPAYSRNNVPRTVAGQCHSSMDKFCHTKDTWPYYP